MFGFVHCNASLLARQATDPQLFFVRVLIKNWLWPIITLFGECNESILGRSHFALSSLRSDRKHSRRDRPDQTTDDHVVDE